MVSSSEQQQEQNTKLHQCFKKKRKSIKTSGHHRVTSHCDICIYHCEGELHELSHFKRKRSVILNTFTKKYILPVNVIITIISDNVRLCKGSCFLDGALNLEV